MKLWFPKVDLGLMAMGVPKETFDKQMEESEDTVAPLAATMARIIDDRLLLTNEYPEEDDTPISPLAPP